jgi:hypothetical protein
MMRHILNGLTVLSLLLGMTVLALWVSGYHFSDKIESPVIPLPTSKSGMLFVWQGYTGSLILAWGDFTSSPPISGEIAVPAWILMTALLVLPCLRIQKAWRAARRLSGGRCPCCGYDLRASPNRCPECGQTARASYGPARRSSKVDPVRGR